MSMAVGGKKGGPMADINVTPMADIMIVLLIIFMVMVTKLYRLTLARRLQGQSPEERTVLVQADDALPYDSVREALRACRDAGAATVMLRANTPR
jgi:biopolymer transport protein ExbD